MEFCIPKYTVIKALESNRLWSVLDKVDGSMAPDRYHVGNMDSKKRWVVSPESVSVLDMVVVNSRTLYKQLLEYKLHYYRTILENTTQSINNCEEILQELGKFSTTETELLNLLERWKDKKTSPAELYKLTLLKRHLNITEFVEEWASYM